MVLVAAIAATNFMAALATLLLMKPARGSVSGELTGGYRLTVAGLVHDPAAPPPPPYHPASAPPPPSLRDGDVESIAKQAATEAAERAAAAAVASAFNEGTRKVAQPKAMPVPPGRVAAAVPPGRVAAPAPADVAADLPRMVLTPRDMVQSVVKKQKMDDDAESTTAAGASSSSAAGGARRCLTCQSRMFALAFFAFDEVVVSRGARCDAIPTRSDPAMLRSRCDATPTGATDTFDRNRTRGEK
jgi:hypothetical protein